MAWNNTNLLFCSSVGQKSNGDLTGLKSRCSRAAFLSEGFRQNPFPYSFWPLEFACIPLLMATHLHFQSQQFLLLLPSLWFSAAGENSKGFVIRLSPWIIQNPLPSRSLVLITSAKSLLPCKIAFTESETPIMGDCCSAYQSSAF